MAGIDFIHQNGVDYEIVPEIAPRFKTTINYAAGDCVIYNAEAYRFKTAHSAGAWIGTDAEKFLVGEELGAIKEDLNSAVDELESSLIPYPVAPDSKYGTNGQLLRSKGDGNTEWTSFGTPTDEQVGEAVEDWLDEHPDATTTVEDGSLTYQKLVTGTLGYVTPEMYGAKGDGVTDDTQAIQDALDAEGTFVLFANKTYMTSGVTLSADKTLIFNYTSLSANTTNQHHILKVVSHVVTYGRVALLGNKKALIGLDIGETNASGNSQIDFVFARYCKLWGVYLNTQTLLLELGKIHVSGCGYKKIFAVTRNDKDKFAIDAGEDKEFLETHFGNSALIVDTTDFKTREDGTKVPFNLVWRASTFVADSDEATTGIITLTSNAQNRISQNYDGERDVYVLLGGGIGWAYDQGGATHIRFINSLSNSVGFAPNGTNRLTVDFMYSQEDAIPIACWGYNIGISVGTFGPEGPLTGIYVYSFDSSNITFNSVSGLLNPSNVANSSSLQNFNTILTIPTIQARRNIAYVQSMSTSNLVIDENTADNYVLRDVTKITVGLDYIDTVANTRTNTNPFGVKTIYVGRLNGAVHNKDVQIVLTSALVTAGYTIQGGTDGSLTLSCTNDTYFIIRIMLLGTVFLVSKESHNVIT